MSRAHWRTTEVLQLCRIDILTMRGDMLLRRRFKQERLHLGGRCLLHVWKHVGMGVEREGNACVPQLASSVMALRFLMVANWLTSPCWKILRSLWQSALRPRFMRGFWAIIYHRPGALATALERTVAQFLHRPERIPMPQYRAEFQS